MMLMILALCCQQAKQPFLAGDWSCAVPTRPGCASHDVATRYPSDAQDAGGLGLQLCSLL